jgi:hypothetical protein
MECVLEPIVRQCRMSREEHASVRVLEQTQQSISSLSLL